MLNVVARSLLVALPILACGSTALSEQGPAAPEDAGAPDSAGTRADPATYLPPDAGPVTGLYGAFHAGTGGEHNLTINTDGTWSQSNWLCSSGPGLGGAGGGSGAGKWEKDGDGLKLLPAASEPDLGWIHGSATSVAVTLVNGRLHTISTSTRGGDTIDFGPGYECYVACGESDEIVLCAKAPKHI